MQTGLCKALGLADHIKLTLQTSKEENFGLEE